MPYSYSPEEILLQTKFSGYMPGLRKAIATRTLVVDTATKMGIIVEPQELQQAADQFRLAHQLKNAQETWNWLESHTLSLEEFQEMVSFTILQKKLSEQLFLNQVEPYFLQHQHQFSQAAIYEIIFDDEDIALEYYYALQEEETNFFEIAQDYISDPESCRKGGYRGYVFRADLHPTLSAAVFGATPPQLLKPRTTAKGVHLIQVDEILELSLTPETHAKILSQLFADWIQMELEK